MATKDTQMEAKLIILLAFSLLKIATAVPFDSSSDDIYIPPLISDIYHKMIEVIEQGNLEIGLKYLEIVKTLHWLEPITLVSDDNTSDSYHYTLRFNISGLSRQEKPTSAQLHIHLMTSDQPAVINITIGIEGFVWRQSEDTKNETEVRINLESLPINSQWINDTLAIKITSTNPIKLPTHYHYHPGLLIYMGGDPEAIDGLLARPLDKPTLYKKKRQISGKEKRNIGEQCRLESFKVIFSEVGGGYQSIIQPKSLDIGQCVGECPQYLSHLRNPTEHAQVWNLLAFRDLDFKGGSGGGDVVSPVSCAVRSFRPQPVLVYKRASMMITYVTYDRLVATSCGCSHCTP